MLLYVYPNTLIKWLLKDNAAMIGWASMHRFLTKDYDDYRINLRAKWNIEELAA